jgi:hypothetical protein
VKELRGLCELASTNRSTGSPPPTLNRTDQGERNVTASGWTSGQFCPGLLGLEEAKLAIHGALPGHRLIEPLGDLRAEVCQEERRGTAVT